MEKEKGKITPERKDIFLSLNKASQVDSYSFFPVFYFAQKPKSK